MTENNLLIYGLRDPRWDYYKEISKNQDIENDSLFIDDYNKVLSLILYYQWKKMIHNKERNRNEATIWDSEENFLKFVKETSGSSKFLEEYREDGKQYPLWEAYFEQFQKQPPMKTLQVIYNDALKKAKTGDIYGIGALKEYSHVIRGCKIGLQLASSKDNLVIHFVLDEMDFEDVVSKDEDGYGTNATSRELRYVYRNWEELKGKVFFIENGKKVPAPWEQNPALWEKYKPKLKQQADAPEMSKVNKASQTQTIIYEKAKLEDVIGKFQESKLTIVHSNEKIGTYVPNKPKGRIHQLLKYVEKMSRCCCSSNKKQKNSYTLSH